MGVICLACTLPKKYSSWTIFAFKGKKENGRDLAEWLERLAVNNKGTTVLGSFLGFFPASSDTMKMRSGR
jgi:hypothetical protein